MRLKAKRFPQVAIYGKAASGGGSLTFTKSITTPVWQNAGSPPLTFAVDIGTASSDRIVVVAVYVDSTNALCAVSGVTANGTALTKDANSFDPAASSTGLYIFYTAPGAVSGSGSQNIVVSQGSFPQGVVVACGIITGSATAARSTSTAVPDGVTADPHSVTAVIPANGVGVVAVLVDRATTPSWTGVSSSDFNVTDPGPNFRAAILAHGTSNTVSFTGANNFETGMLMTTFGP